MNALARNHFALFGLSVGFALDIAVLETAYRRVQGAVHPDRFTGAPDAERRLALQLATQANEAYRTLRDPLGRAAYLCELNGHAPSARAVMSADFLVRQMDWRERLQDACAGRDAVAIDSLRGECVAERDALIGHLERSIDHDADFGSALAWVNQLSFVERLIDELDDAEQRVLQR